MEVQQKLDLLYRAQEISKIGNWDQDYPDGKLWWSDQVYRIFGLEPQSVDIDFEKFLSYVHPDDRQIIRRATEEAISTENLPYRVEYRILLENLGERYIYEEAVVDRGSNGEPVKMAGIIQDITGRKKVEMSLRDSREMYRSLVETTSAVAWEMDLESMKFTYVSPVIENVLGYQVDEWTGFDFWAEHIHPDDREKAVNYCIFETDNNRDHAFEYRFIAADGRIFWIKDIVSLFREGSKAKSLRGFFLDITDLKDKQEKLQKSNLELEARIREQARETLALQKEMMIKEKLAEVGRLAAGVRHDLRNPLGIISNAVYYLKMKLSVSDDKKVLNHLGLIEKESNRCNDIISELLDFSKVITPKKSFTEMCSFLREQLEIMDIPREVSVILDCSKDSFKAMIDTVQISRVIRNIVTNAIQGMEGKGELKISCKEEDEMAVISFADNGKGIPAENLIQIFDPLFSTKQNGVGMGLANVRNFVNLHNGEIEVESEEGKGSVFTIVLPVD